jgi:TrmH family RNA methyltransferase
MTNNELIYYENLKRKKHRNSEGCFLIEGIHLIEECLKSKYYNRSLEKIIVRKDLSDTNYLKRIKKITDETELVYLEKNRFKKLTETNNQQGIIGIVKKTFSKKTIKKNLIVALDKLNDPGNLGTIIRTCHWFDVDEILLSKNSVELFNSKVIRATQGALFNIIIKEEQELSEELQKLLQQGFHIYLTDTLGKKPLNEIKFHTRENNVLVFGNEANGISEEISCNNSYKTIQINRVTNCESLNVGVSVGIVLYSFRN